MDKLKSFVSAVVYVRNNEKTIVSFISSLCNILKTHFYEYEIICVNDASSDQSVNMLKKVIAENADCVVNLITLSYFQGVEKAMNAGIDLAIGDMVYEFDCAIMDYNPSLILDVFYKMQEGADIVSASPKNTLRIGSAIYYNTIRTFNKNIRPIQTETFRIVSRRALNRVEIMSKSIPFRQVLYSMCGLKCETLLYQPTSKNGIALEHKYRRELAINTLLLFTNLGERIALSCIAIFTVIDIFFLLYKGFCKEFFYFFGITGISTLIGIVIKYLSILKDLLFTQQKYIIENVEKLN